MRPAFLAPLTRVPVYRGATSFLGVFPLRYEDLPTKLSDLSHNAGENVFPLQQLIKVTVGYFD